MRHAVDWLKTHLEDFCSPEELSSLSAKAFRKGFGNWAQTHPDPEVRKWAPEAQVRKI